MALSVSLNMVPNTIDSTFRWGDNSLYHRGRHGRDRMVVGFTTTYAISAYNHWCCWFESRPGRGVQHYVIKFVSDLRQVGGGCPSVSSINKTDHHDILEILLKVVLNTIKQTNIWLYLTVYECFLLDHW